MHPAPGFLLQVSLQRPSSELECPKALHLSVYKGPDPAIVLHAMCAGLKLRHIHTDCCLWSKQKRIALEQDGVLAGHSLR